MIGSMLGYIAFLLIAIFQKQIMKFLDIFGENNAWNRHYKNKKLEKIILIFVRIICFLIGAIGLVNLILRK